jgi:integrase
MPACCPIRIRVSLPCLWRAASKGAAVPGGRPQRRARWRARRGAAQRRRLDHAERSGRIRANPARGLGLPRIQRRDYIFLTHEQLHELSSAAGHWRVFVLLLGYTGLRWGEATALRVCDLDLGRRRIDVRRAKMLQEILGHASITTTLDLYGHLYPGDMDRYADRLDSAADEASKSKIRPDETEAKFTG